MRERKGDYKSTTLNLFTNEVPTLTTWSYLVNIYLGLTKYVEGKINGEWSEEGRLSVFDCIRDEHFDPNPETEREPYRYRTDSQYTVRYQDYEIR
ncbi:hypothetical protein Tco_1333537 [Tanacetum coccineum]